MAMGLIRLVRELTDFPIHKHAAHVIRKVSHHPVTGVWRAEGWKTGEQHRFRLQIRRVLGTNVDINRLFERLQPARWTGDDIADCIAWAASRPAHVNIDEILVRPRAQATATAVHRDPT